MIKLYSSLSRKKEVLPPPGEQRKIRLFVCGPTVYDYAHIGHARTYIFFDFFANYLRTQGYEVTYLQNITDVDDKIIKRATEEKKKPEAIAKFFTKAYLEDMKALGVHMAPAANATGKPSDKILYAPATEFISQIVAQVERLIDKEYAYKIEDDGWYFDISKFKDYGKLSGRTALQAEDAVSRIDESIGKKNKGDFCLWKFSRPGEPVWTAAIGNGRPGWHIEDTSITEFYFGPQYEIHGGGVDLKFPHHEAEIAQQEAASGRKPLAQIWMHTGALLVDGKKMSKSLGNFITIRDFLKKYPPGVLRLIVFMQSYRSPIHYSEKLADGARAALETIKQFLGKLSFLSTAERNMFKNIGAVDHFADFDRSIGDALADDMDTATVIAQIFMLISNLNPRIWELDPTAAKRIHHRTTQILAMLGIELPQAPKIPAKVKELADQREQFRANKQFDKSDTLRMEINGLGYEIEDTPQGPFLWPRPKNRN